MDSAEPLPSWLWRNSWKYSSFFATPLSQMLAYTTEILHWQFFFHPQHFFSLLILWGLFWGGFFWFGFVCVFFPCGFFFFFFVLNLFYWWAHRDLSHLSVAVRKRQWAAFSAWHGRTTVSTGWPLLWHLLRQNRLHSAELRQNKQ